MSLQLLGAVSLTAEAARVEHVDTQRRIITGLVVPYGVGGRTNLGHGLKIRAGAVAFHEPARRVIGLYGHDRDRTVSRMVGYSDGPDGMRMSLKVPTTPLGDQLLAEADPDAGVRSMLSIELDDCQLDQWTGEVVAGRCEFVAHVPIGAYDHAEVTSVIAAAHNNPGGHDVFRRPLHHRTVIDVGGGGQPQQPAQQPPAPGWAPQAPAPTGQWWLAAPQAPAQPPAQQPPAPGWAPQAPAPQQQPGAAWGPQAPAQQPPAPGWGQQQPAPPQQPPSPQGLQLTAEQTAAVGAFLAAQQQPAFQPGHAYHPWSPAAAPGQQPAQLPGGLPAGAAPQQQQTGKPQGFVRKLAQLQAAQATGQDGIQLRAALADITNSSVDLFQRPAGGIGEELWSGGGYTRRFTGLMAQKELTAWKFGGWRWVMRPEVDDYAGDKTEIPTNQVSVEPVEGEAERLAGGWDVDRKFRDFGDSAFWEGFYSAQTESYSEKSDLRAAAAIVAAARSISVAANVPAGYAAANVAQADILRAAALGSAIMEDTPNVRRPADYVLMNTSDWLGLMDFTGLELPAFLALLGVQPGAFQRTSEVPPGQVVLGVRPAMTWYELGGGAPIRVEALDVARAGIDSAVYGYTGTLLNRPGGVISVPLVPPS